MIQVAYLWNMFWTVIVNCSLIYVHPFNILSSLIIEQSTIWWKCYLKSGIDVSLKCLQNCYFIDVPSELSLFLSNGMFLHFMCVFHLNGVDLKYKKVYFLHLRCMCVWFMVVMLKNNIHLSYLIILHKILYLCLLLPNI